MSAPWKGGDERPETFGDRGKAWLRRRVYNSTVDSLAKGGWSPEMTQDIVDWFIQPDRIDRYVKWEWMECDMWNGRRPRGHWHFNRSRFLQDYPGALEFAKAQYWRRKDAEVIVTLDDWLAADIAGVLDYAGDPGGMARVAKPIRELCTIRRHYKSERIVCGDCGAGLFKDHWKAVRCRVCRGRRRGELVLPTVHEIWVLDGAVIAEDVITKALRTARQAIAQSPTRAEAEEQLRLVLQKWWRLPPEVPGSNDCGAVTPRAIAEGSKR